MMKADSTQSLGDRVRATRRSMGLRQGDLSAMTGLPTSHLSDIERSAITPTIPTLRKIGEALNRPLEYFLQEDSVRPRSLGMVIHGTSIGGKAAVKFAELMDAKTNGEVKLRLYQYSALGTAREQVEALIEGAIHTYIDEIHSLEPYAELCGSAFLPYFFRDREHYYRFLRSKIFEEHIFQKLLGAGIRLLNPVSNWECGSFEVLFSTEPIFTPEDLAGRRFRSYPSRAAIALRRALGAEPVSVEWAQTFEAFEQGLIDTLLVPAAYVRSSQMHKLAKYATLLDYGYTLNLTIAVSEREYLKLSPDVQRVLVEAAQEAGEYCTRLAKEETAVDLRHLSEEHGVPVIQPNQKAWRAQFSAAICEICNSGLLAPRLYEELQSL